MSVVQSGNRLHDTACSIAEGVRQVAVAAAGNNQAAANAATIVFYRTVVASARANSLEAGQFSAALAELGLNA